MWNRIEQVPNIVNYTDVNQIIENQHYLAESFSLYLDVQMDLGSIVARPDMKYDEIPQIYELIERNLDVLNDNELKSAYYVEPLIRGEYEPNALEWQRWIDVINDIYDIIEGINRKWAYLVLQDGMPIIEDKKIILRGEYLYG